MSLRAPNISVSLDGFGTGEGQSLESPFGHAGQRLHGWFFATPTWPGRRPVEEQGLAPGAAEDDVFARRAFEGFGAEIMGAGKFGPPGWQDDAAWEGWWGEDTPFHTPVYVLTHRPRPDLVLGDTTFLFRDSSPAEVLAEATTAAGDLDVRLGGGPTTIRLSSAAAWPRMPRSPNRLSRTTATGAGSAPSTACGRQTTSPLRSSPM